MVAVASCRAISRNNAGPPRAEPRVSTSRSPDDPEPRSGGSGRTSELDTVPDERRRQAQPAASAQTAFDPELGCPDAPVLDGRAGDLRRHLPRAATRAIPGPPPRGVVPRLVVVVPVEGPIGT